MEVKICGLKYKENIEAVVALQPDYIGMIFYQGSKRYIGNDNRTCDYIKSISTVQKTGVFVNASLSMILETAKLYKLDLVQLHGCESSNFCATISMKIPVIKAFAIHKNFDFNDTSGYLPYCSYFLFDRATAHFGGSGQTFDWTLLQKYSLSKNFLLSGGIAPENIQQVKQVLHPQLKGIDVNSRFEIAPGLKDIPAIKSLLHEIHH